MKKYVVITVVLEMSSEDAGRIDAQTASELACDVSKVKGIDVVAVRALVNKCYTQDEAVAISRQGAP